MRLAERRGESGLGDQAAGRSHRAYLCGTALILVIAEYVYWPVLTSPYVYETTRRAEGFFRPWQGWSYELSFFWHYPTRFITHVSFLVSHALGGNQPSADHLGNLCVHLMNISLLSLMAAPFGRL